MPDRSAQTLPASPFVRLRALLDSHSPARPALSLALGEPRHAPPEFVLNALAADSDGYANYPPIQGLPQWRDAAMGWLSRRFGISAELLCAPSQILPLNGTREGLFLAAQIAPPKTDGVMAMPNPFYQVYASAARAAGATPIYLDAPQETGFLPDLDALDADTLGRLRALYLCSPANPQGAIADMAYLEKAYQLACRHDFLLLVDECYAEIYDTRHAPSPSILQVMAAHADDDAPVLVFHSLSKRSNLPGLRSGFCAGGRSAMQAYFGVRSVAGPQSPAPVQRAAALAWGDDAHVAENRALYQAKFDAADEIFADWPGYQRPAGGFFLWLPVVGGGEAASLRLWCELGIQVLPGAYLTQPSADGGNIGDDYIRIALVGDLAETQTALAEIAACLAPSQAAYHDAQIDAVQNDVAETKEGVA